MTKNSGKRESGNGDDETKKNSKTDGKESLKRDEESFENVEWVRFCKPPTGMGGCWMLDVGCWMLDVGCWMLDVGCWMLDVGCWMLDVGCWMVGWLDGGWLDG
jgi:hypothetical protein